MDNLEKKEGGIIKIEKTNEQILENFSRNFKQHLEKDDIKGAIEYSEFIKAGIEKGSETLKHELDIARIELMINSKYSFGAFAELGMCTHVEEEYPGEFDYDIQLIRNIIEDCIKDKHPFSLAEKILNLYKVNDPNHEVYKAYKFLIA